MFGCENLNRAVAFESVRFYLTLQLILFVNALIDMAAFIHEKVVYNFIGSIGVLAESKQIQNAVLISVEILTVMLPVKN